MYILYAFQFEILQYTISLKMVLGPNKTMS